MGGEYTEGTNSDGCPILIRNSDDHSVLVDADNEEFCRLLNSPMDDIMPADFHLSGASWQFFGQTMKGDFIDCVRTNGMILFVEEDHTFLRLKTIDNQSPINGCAFKKVCHAIASHSNTDIDGLMHYPSHLCVSDNLLTELNNELRSDETCESTIRKLSSSPVRLAFVYIDVSDFSRYPAGQQALIISSLGSLTSNAHKWLRANENWIFRTLQSQFCIGDGYIYCFENGLHATYFAARLASKIEEAVANRTLPVQFHFRGGVHVGPVYQFWDYGRGNWNYIGDGIIGGSRVLEAIGKQTDDVVFVSDAVRNELLQNRPEHKLFIDNLVESLHNRGRREDKHGNMWRVYELNHMNVK